MFVHMRNIDLLASHQAYEFRSYLLHLGPRTANIVAVAVFDFRLLFVSYAEPINIELSVGVVL